MQSFIIPGTDLSLSRLGHGWMHFGGSWDAAGLGDADVQVARAGFEAAREAGFTLFDHADIYKRGRAEEVFGRVLAEHPSWRSSIVIQSKCGIRFADPRSAYPVKHYDASKATIMDCVEQSLRRLRTSYLDILLLHRPDVLMEPEEVAAAADELQKAGKVRHFGISNAAPSQIDLLNRHLREPLRVHQIELSLLHHRLIDESVLVNHGTVAPTHTGLLDHARSNGMVIQAWSPLAGGRLLRSTHGETDPKIHRLVECVQRMADEWHVSREAIMLAWLLRIPGLVQPIIGSTQPDRIRAAAQADRVHLSREAWYTLWVAARGEELP